MENDAGGHIARPAVLGAGLSQGGGEFQQSGRRPGRKCAGVRADPLLTLDSVSPRADSLYVSLSAHPGVQIDAGHLGAHHAFDRAVSRGWGVSARGLGR
jgi:hypothetical protein